MRINPALNTLQTRLGTLNIVRPNQAVLLAMPADRLVARVPQTNRASCDVPTLAALTCGRPGAGVNVRSNAAAAARKADSNVPVLVIRSSGMPAEDQKLRDAAAWIADRYPQLLPKSPRNVAIADVKAGDEAGTTPFDGRIKIKPGLSDTEMRSALAHELMHSHPETMLARRAEQSANDAPEHDFLYKADAAVRAHAAYEARYGAADPRELFFAKKVNEHLAFASDGSPEVWMRTAPGGDQVQHRVMLMPESSVIRKSFEQ